jgi:hypothetical protein
VPLNNNLKPKQKTTMETIEVVKAGLKADRKETKEMWKIIEVLYSDITPEIKQKAVDYIDAYREHYEKNLKMIANVLRKLNSQP